MPATLLGSRPTSSDISFAIMKYLFYPYLMGISAIIAIVWYHRKNNKSVVLKEEKVV